MARTAVLQVGDTAPLGFFFFKPRICYAGMPSEGVFSIARRGWDWPHLVYGWNLYFPVSQTEIHLDGTRIVVQEVTPTEIRLQIG